MKMMLSNISQLGETGLSKSEDIIYTLTAVIEEKAMTQQKLYEADNRIQVMESEISNYEQRISNLKAESAQYE